MPSKQVVAKSLIFHQDKVLLLVRADHDLNRPGDFDLPGGGVDLSDGSIAEAASREIYEETRLQIPSDMLKEIVLPLDLAQERVQRHVFLGKSVSDNVTVDPNEHKSYQWVELEEAIQLFKHRFYNPVMVHVLHKKSR